MAAQSTHLLQHGLQTVGPDVNHTNGVNSHSFWFCCCFKTQVAGYVFGFFFIFLPKCSLIKEVQRVDGCVFAVKLYRCLLTCREHETSKQCFDGFTLSAFKSNMSVQKTQ